jgi:hypothetical protein
MGGKLLYSFIVFSGVLNGDRHSLVFIVFIRWKREK